MVVAYTVTSPVEDYEGEVAGARFINGRAQVEESNTAALGYFRRRGYTITGGGSGRSAGDGADKPSHSASKADWVAWAVGQGAEQDDAEAKTKTQLVEQYG